jgi:hypothetical protein
MARKLESFKEGGYTTPSRSRYPWDEWMDGGIWEVKRGEDFQVSEKSMASTLYAQARAKNQRVSVRVADGKVAFMFMNGSQPNG